MDLAYNKDLIGHSSTLILDANKLTNFSIGDKGNFINNYQNYLCPKGQECSVQEEVEKYHIKKEKSGNLKEKVRKPVVYHHLNLILK